MIEGKKVESSSSEGEEEEEESEEEGGPEKEIPLEKKPKKEEVAPILKEVDTKKDLDDTKDGLLQKVYEVEMGSEEEDEGDNEQLYEDLQRIKQK